MPLKNEKPFFWDGAGEPERAVNNWRSRLMKLFRLAESRTGEGKPFASKPHPHRFRHTFAAEYLSASVPIETVSLLLGHASVKVTERHYAKFNRARQERIDDAVRMAWKVKRPKFRVLKGGSLTGTCNRGARLPGACRTWWCCSDSSCLFTGT